MSNLLPFQAATVKAALRALTLKSGPRRFLVADEVGLGKTVVAREVARGLMSQLGHPINVLYLCPSLEIAHQNNEKLVQLTGLPIEDYERGADRLSLALRDPPQLAGGFRIFAFTPETSLPSWKSGVRTGRKLERNLIGALLAHCFPNAWRHIEQSLTASGRQQPLFQNPAAYAEDAKQMAQAFTPALREMLVSADVERALDEGPLQKWFDKNGVLELILRARCALALTALRSTKIAPHLIVVDEFHRFGDLLAGTTPDTPKQRRGRQEELRKERRSAHQCLMNALMRSDGEDPAALLMLSATPYRLQKVDGTPLFHSERYGSLVRLVEFLYGAEGAMRAEQVKAAIQEYQAALHSDGADAIARVVAAREPLERLLRPVIARTERALAADDSLFEKQTIQVTVRDGDLSLFRHFAHCLGKDHGYLRSFVPPLWASVPYPAQTLHGYAVWKALKSAPLPSIQAHSAVPHAHPQFRALIDGPIAYERLALPWHPPTLPWWKLEKPWSGRNQGKALLFSQYRASPSAISALVSLGVERLGGSIESEVDGGTKAKPYASQAYLRLGGKPGPKLFAMFFPWPTLSLAIDPVKTRATVGEVRHAAEKELRAWLKKNGCAVEPAAQPGPVRDAWRILFGLETRGRRAEGGALLRGIEKIGGMELKKTINVLGAPETIRAITPAELSELANFLLGAPGPLVARVLQRHDVPADVPKVFELCWRKLRPYLGQRHFKGAILGNRHRGYPEALMHATVAGGLESALDEHVALLQRLYDHKGKKILDELMVTLMDRPGNVRLRRSSKDARVRVHAATPFAGGVQKARGGKEEKLRSDSLRRAFNSPFWPHLLATTSVGQEGLDFHVWCDRIIHWDMPRDPVEFEQREGRVSRYASLAVRRGLAKTLGDGARRVPHFTSPFARLLHLAETAKVREEESGLNRWWIGETRPKRIVFEWPFSLRSLRHADLERNLFYYRLGLGQPEPDLFMAFLRNLDVEPSVARILALNLCPLVRANGLTP